MDFKDLIQNFGLAVACLIALGLGTWRALKWVGANVLKPMADRHIRFIDEVATVVKDQAGAIVSSNMNILKISEAIISISRSNKDTLDRIEAVTEQLRNVAQGISEVKSVVLKSENVTIVPSRKKNDPSSG